MRRLMVLLFFTVFFTMCNALPLTFSLQNEGGAESVTVKVGAPAELITSVPQDGSFIVVEWENALQNAIDETVIFDEGSNNKVNLSVKILGLEASGLGLDIKTVSIAQYELIDRASGRVIYTTEVRTDGIASEGSAAVEAVRTQESISHSIQNNVSEFLNRLQEAMVSE